IETDLAEDLRSVALHAAVVVVQPDARETADEPVEDPARQHLVPRIITFALPTADDVVLGGEGIQKAGDLGRVILQVGVHGEDGIAASVGETGGEGGRLAEVAAKADAAHARVVVRELLDDLPGAVARAVVDEEDLEVHPDLREVGANLTE